MQNQDINKVWLKGSVTAEYENPWLVVSIGGWGMGGGGDGGMGGGKDGNCRR